MKKGLRFAAGICIAGALLSSVWLADANAFGLGLYGATGSSSGDLKYEYSDETTMTPPPDATYNKDTEHKTFGIVMDSAVAKDKLFNYRLSVGSEKFKLKPGQGSSTLNLDGVVFDNDFGFGIVRTEHIRLWFGPELRIAVVSGEETSGSNTAIRDVTMVGLGLGPVLGININLGKVAALCLKSGYLYNSYAGSGEGKTVGTTTVIDTDYTMKEKLLYFNIAFLFRLGDD